MHDIEIIGAPVYYEKDECLHYAQRLEQTLHNGEVYYHVPGTCGDVVLGLTYEGKILNISTGQKKNWTIDRRAAAGLTSWAVSTMTPSGAGTVSKKRAFGLVFVENPHPKLNAYASTTVNDEGHVLRPTDVFWKAIKRTNDYESVFVLKRGSEQLYYDTLVAMLYFENPKSEQRDLELARLTRATLDPDRPVKFYGGEVWRTSRAQLFDSQDVGFDELEAPLGPDRIGITKPNETYRFLQTYFQQTISA